MIIEKEIVSKTLRDYIFITGIFDIDSKYLKKRVEEGVKISNINYTTNVYGKHTAWKFFNEDEKFLSVLLQIIDHLERLDVRSPSFKLGEAWGLVENFGNYTRKHNHNSQYLSGVLYLNDHDQKLFFPEINQEVTPKTGRFALFSSFLNHYTKRNLKHKDKYAISFNLSYNIVW
mgnify:CR=1 FL=1